MSYFKSLIVFGLVLSFFYADAAQKTVQQKQVKLRKNPALLAESIGELQYLDEVSVLEEKKTWSKVQSLKNKKLSGWIPSASLTPHSPVKLKKASQVDLSEGAVALAGKGFSSEHESAMKKRDQKLDFAKVDQVESLQVSDEQLKDFVRGSGFKAAKPRGTR